MQKAIVLGSQVGNEINLPKSVSEHGEPGPIGHDNVSTPTSLNCNITDDVSSTCGCSKETGGFVDARLYVIEFIVLPISSSI